MSVHALLERQRTARIPNWAEIIPRAERYSLDAPISVFQQNGTTSFFRIRNLSSSGARLIRSRPITFKVGQTIFLDLFGADAVKARIVRHEDKELAVEFASPLSQTLVVATAMYYASRYAEHRSAAETRSCGELGDQGSVGAMFAILAASVVGCWSFVAVALAM